LRQRLRGSGVHAPTSQRPVARNGCSIPATDGGNWSPWRATGAGQRKTASPRAGVLLTEAECCW
ncbi:MAG: hypothetical protein AAFP03_17935, partial [Cyanobacteria bacterium J06598_3]